MSALKRLLILLFAMTLGLGHADVPKLFSEQSFTSITLATAVNHYVLLGKDEAVKELEDLSDAEAAETEKNRGFNSRGFSINERISWVCRILFEPKSDARQPYLRPPKFGKLNLPVKFMPIEDWPLFPVVLSGSTYFVMSESYSDDNHVPEEPKHYIEYCRDNGVFRTTLIKLTRAQILKDADALHKSAPWQAIRWEDDDGSGYPMGDQWTWGFIQKQAMAPAK
jgi:hypothetical protein